ncbi:putative FNIP repeat-containing protein [Acanthamoeba polyphaga mimivirus]|uniref:Putative FNIP repeat-containing protein n=1 Tax=Acanthamoeba polyphaga mimivirus TaxID=212035 RepID=A0A0G2Y7J5_MIMIV|nr:putative FNIP repeat-containing protein [Acanthamoeba polyphaga mimivirus]
MSILQILDNDVLRNIIDYLDLKYETTFVSTCQYLYYYRKTFRRIYRLEKIIVFELKNSDHIIPENTTHLVITFNQPIGKINIPKNVSRLTFCPQFNKSIDDIPSTITHLLLGAAFNGEVSNIPTSVAHLKLDVSFKRKLSEIPLSVTHLTLNSYDT